MRHLVILEYGYSLGIRSARVSVRYSGNVIKELPLTRLKTITVSTGGVSLSSDLIQACSIRGISIFFTDFKGEVISALMGAQQHAVVSIRKHQFRASEQIVVWAPIMTSVIIGKIKNQRSVLLYFAKYLRKKNALDELETLIGAQRSLSECEERIRGCLVDLNVDTDGLSFRRSLMGHEGSAASIYWQALVKAGLMPSSFARRLGHGAGDLGNQVLNYGYAILGSTIWQAIHNAGLEAYCGFLHVDRPGKPSLVLDLMEEYRPWVVDRIVIANRAFFDSKGEMRNEVKSRLITQIKKSLGSRVVYGDRSRPRLDTVIQRQVYKFTAALIGGKPYKSYRFKW